jgi:hypothetical protein
MKLLTKKQIAEIWTRDAGPKENEPCCPDCKDNLKKNIDEILIKNINEMMCTNFMCKNIAVYSIKTYEIVREMDYEEQAKWNKN